MRMQVPSSPDGMGSHVTLLLISNPLKVQWGVLAHVADEPIFELLYLSSCLAGGSGLPLGYRYWSLHLEVLTDH